MTFRGMTDSDTDNTVLGVWLRPTAVPRGSVVEAAPLSCLTSRWLAALLLE